MSHPVTVKGIVTIDGQVVLVRNERREWELPGGRPDIGETERETLAREVREELGVDVDVGPEPLDHYDFAPIPGRLVRVVTYPCSELNGDQQLRLSDEHVAVARFSPAAVAELKDLPEGYRDSIRRFFER